MPRTTSAMQNPESLEAIAKQLQQLAFTLLAAKDEMQNDKIPALRVNGYASLILGMKNISTFASAAVDAVREYREGNGEFRADKRTKK